MTCCSLRCRQFWLLLWKNFILQIRRPVGTVFEVILPLLAVVFVIAIRFSTGAFRAEDRCFVTFPSDPLTISKTTFMHYSIFYAPNDSTTSVLAAMLYSKLPINTSFEGFSDGQAMEEALTALQRGNLSSCFLGGAGIVFDNLTSPSLEYTLRLRHDVGERNTWFTRLNAPTFQLAGARVSENFYLSEGFLHLQSLVGQSLVEWLTGQEQNITVAVRQMPYPSYRRDLFLQTVGSILPLLLILSFLYSAGIIVKELVLEKETRIRESMLMMGLQQWVLWATWYLKELIFLLLSVIIMGILLKVGQVFPMSNLLLLLVFLVLFIFSMISFCFLVSVFFNSARVGLIMGFVLWLVNYFPYFFLPARFAELSLAAKVCACLLSNTCVGLGAEVLSRLELREEGLQFSNFAQPLSLDDDFNMAWVCGMLALDAIWYMLLAWYINAVKPGEYGVPRPLWFPFQPSYWTGRTSRTKLQEAQVLVEAGAEDYEPSAHEEEPEGLEAGVTINNLTKVYNQNVFTRLFESATRRREHRDSRRVAVNSLSLNMYRGQITALLGHNGAGKTTTMSMLTGLYTPTSGNAIINGYSILDSIDQIRQSLGICPQHNVLFDRLTVQEHLRFFSRLKGMSGQRMQEEVQQMVADLQLLGREKVAAGKLSGGMKRKLSVGIALVGGSEVVILDEPTSGMDPYARRATWDLLAKYKAGRTMLLTTHFMDEADLLGDRIAILAEGKLRCSGSSLFLKSRYGVGYHMTIVKEEACVSSQVAELVRSMVSNAEQVTDVGAELSFILPSSSTPHFPQLFDTLEARKAELGISAFGVSITTMEEVFMKVGEGTDEALDARLRGAMSPRATSPSPASPSLTGLAVVDVESNMADEDEEGPARSSLSPRHQPEVQPSLLEVAETAYLPRDSTASELQDGEQLKLTARDRYDYVPNTGAALWMQQFWAMFVKRFFNTIRFYGSAILQLAIPALFVLFGLVVVVTVPSNSENDPPRALRLSSSALSNENITLFYAQFGNSLPVNFSSVDAAEFRVNELFDYTDEVQSIIDRVEASPPSQPSHCCNYQKQLLDQYCASQTPGTLMNTCEDNADFGYNTCTDCLSCCGATQAKLQSCSSPLTLLSDPSQADLCPSPPLVTVGTQPSGALNSKNTFVAEHLLNISVALQPTVFFARFLAGFVLSSRDPPYSVCGCSDGFSPPEELSDTSTCEFISPLQPMSDDRCPSYRISEPCQSAWGVCLLTGNCTLRDLIPGCRNLTGVSSAMPGSGSGSGSGSDAGNDTCDSILPGCYTVNGVSTGILEAVSCGEGMSSGVGCNTLSNNARPVGRFAPQQEEQVSATVWYNNQPYHAPPAALNAFHTVWLREATGDDSLTLTVNNHPLPRNPETAIDDATTNFIGFGVSTLVVFGYSFLLASFVLFLVKEKETKAKHLQFVSGVHVTSYWLATFAWDLLNSFIPVVVSVILFAVFQVDEYSGVNTMAVFLLLLLTCWAAIPITYSVSFIFSNSLAAYALLVVAFYLGAVLMQTLVLLLDEEPSRILHYIFLTFPTYGLAIGLNDIYTNSFIRNLCTQNERFMQLCALPNSNVTFTDSPFDFARPGIGSILTYMAVEGLLLFMFPMLIERSFFFPELRSLLLRAKRPQPYAAAAEPLLHGEDSDVYAERKKVLSGGTDENDAVIIKNLVKTYSATLSGCSIKPANTAVRGISLALPTGQCFGLLGVNGAGKTTTFSIITGDKSMSSGTAMIAGYDIRSSLREVQQRIGYCPQFDGLIERLTGQELLTMFARLRGVPEKQIKEVVSTEIRRLDLSKHAKKRCGTYSGGNKRKLSTAIALVGNPPIVLLDEPTTGMDPTTRRYLWDVLTGVTQEGRTIVLTSHSMEECEALCTRLAIMVNGSFKCLGSVQHLKNKYGAGYTLQAKVKLSPNAEPPPLLKRSSSKRISLRRSASNASRSKSPARSKSPSHSMSPSHSAVSEPAVNLAGGGVANNPFNPFDTTSLHIFIREAFPNALLLEEHQGAVTYQLPSAGVSWSSVFRQLESNKERLGIIDYSVSQTSLEQVFINFAKEQNEESAL